MELVDAWEHKLLQLDPCLFVGNIEKSLKFHANFPSAEFKRCHLTGKDCQIGQGHKSWSRLRGTELERRSLFDVLLLGSRHVPLSIRAA